MLGTGLVTKLRLLGRFGYAALSSGHGLPDQAHAHVLFVVIEEYACPVIMLCASHVYVHMPVVLSSPSLSTLR